MTQPIYDERVLSDLHKDARGFRPSSDWFQAWNEMDVPARNALWTSLCDDVDTAIETERAQTLQAIARLEDRIAEQAHDLGVSVQTMVRWDMDAHQVGDHGVGYYLYLCGISSLEYEADFKRRYT